MESVLIWLILCQWSTKQNWLASLWMKARLQVSSLQGLIYKCPLTVKKRKKLKFVNLPDPHMYHQVDGVREQMGNTHPAFSVSSSPLGCQSLKVGSATCPLRSARSSANGWGLWIWWQNDPAWPQLGPRQDWAVLLTRPQHFLPFLTRDLPFLQLPPLLHHPLLRKTRESGSSTS